MFSKRRPVIGIPFNYDESWIGGTYYVKNLIGNLGLLPESEQPEVWLLSHGQESFDFIRKATGYPRLHWQRPALIAGIDGGLSRRTRLFNRLMPRFMKRELTLDVIYPFPIDTRLRQTVCWIPDFQEKHLPEFFTEDELAARDKQHRFYFENFDHIVFSSAAACADFDRFYPEAKVERHVVHFAVHEGVGGGHPAEEVLARYSLPQRFFYCPNQFWVHKNHGVVIRAVELLRQQGKAVTVVFSGKEHDHRMPGYTDKLKRQVADAGLTEQIRFIGFIPREDQITLFREASCIVQPSLFEGWSTVIEDAKSVSQFVLASSIPANLEQANANIAFFEPHDAEALASRMADVLAAPPSRQTIDYRHFQLEFARAFMSVVQAVMHGGTKASPGAP